MGVTMEIAVIMRIKLACLEWGEHCGAPLPSHVVRSRHLADDGQEYDRRNVSLCDRELRRRLRASVDSQDEGSQIGCRNASRIEHVWRHSRLYTSSSPYHTQHS